MSSSAPDARTHVEVSMRAGGRQRGGAQGVAGPRGRVHRYTMSSHVTYTFINKRVEAGVDGCFNILESQMLTLIQRKFIKN